jgi:hypothetical protein
MGFHLDRPSLGGGAIGLTDSLLRAFLRSLGANPGPDDLWCSWRHYSDLGGATQCH